MRSGALKNDLVRPGKALVWSQVEQVIRLEARVTRLAEIQEDVDGAVDELQSIAGQWSDLKTELDGIRTSHLSVLDRRKIQLFQELVQKLLGSFGFQSFGSGEIELTEDDFRPQAVKQEGRWGTI